MDMKKNESIMPNLHESPMIERGDQGGEIKFSLKDFIFLELLEQHNITLNDGDEETILSCLTQIDQILNGKTKKIKLFENTITDKDVRALEKRYILANTPKASTTKSVSKKANEKGKLILKFESAEPMIVRKVAFLKEGSYEILVFDEPLNAGKEKMKVQLKLDLSNRLTKGIWVDIMALKEHNTIALRCVNLVSREILLEEERCDRQYGI